jgi:hypothetical protein
MRPKHCRGLLARLWNRPGGRSDYDRPGLQRMSQKCTDNRTQSPEHRQTPHDFKGTICRLSSGICVLSSFETASTLPGSQSAAPSGLRNAVASGLQPWTGRHAGARGKPLARLAGAASPDGLILPSLRTQYAVRCVRRDAIPAGTKVAVMRGANRRKVP